MPKAPSKPTPTDKKSTPAVGPPKPPKDPLAPPTDKRQKTITIPLTAELEKHLDATSAKVENEYGFRPTQAQSITTLIKQLLSK